MSPEQTTEEKFIKAQKMTRINAIITVIFSSLTLLGCLIYALFIVPNLLGAPAIEYQSATQSSLGLVLLFIVFFLIAIPNIYLLISGILLMRRPKPTTVRKLTLTNVIVCGIGSVLLFPPAYIVTLIVSILALMQTGDYERGYITV